VQDHLRNCSPSERAHRVSLQTLHPARSASSIRTRTHELVEALGHVGRVQVVQLQLIEGDQLQDTSVSHKKQSPGPQPAQKGENARQAGSTHPVAVEERERHDVDEAQHRDEDLHAGAFSVGSASNTTALFPTRGPSRGSSRGSVSVASQNAVQDMALARHCASAAATGLCHVRRSNSYSPCMCLVPMQRISWRTPAMSTACASAASR
jgi:hypothetical protein